MTREPLCPAPTGPQPVVRSVIPGPRDPLGLGPTEQDVTVGGGGGGGADVHSLHSLPLDMELSDAAVGKFLEGSSLLILNWLRQ